MQRSPLPSWVAPVSVNAGWSATTVDNPEWLLAALRSQAHFQLRWTEIDAAPTGRQAARSLSPR